MSTDTPSHVCETCGHTYQVDDLADTHMDPPDDYARGFYRYCLGCWLGVGPNDIAEMEREARQSPTESSQQ